MARSKPRHALTPTYVKHARVTGVTIATAALLTTTAPFVHAADEPTTVESAAEAATAAATAEITTAATKIDAPLITPSETPPGEATGSDVDEPTAPTTATISPTNTAPSGIQPYSTNPAVDSADVTVPLNGSKEYRYQDIGWGHLETDKNVLAGKSATSADGSVTATFGHSTLTVTHNGTANVGDTQVITLNYTNEKGESVTLTVNTTVTESKVGGGFTINLVTEYGSAVSQDMTVPDKNLYENAFEGSIGSVPEELRTEDTNHVWTNNKGNIAVFRAANGFLVSENGQAGDEVIGNTYEFSEKYTAKDNTVYTLNFRVTVTAPQTCKQEAPKPVVQKDQTTLTLAANSRNTGTVKIFNDVSTTGITTPTDVRVTNSDELEKGGVHVDPAVTGNWITFNVTTDKDVTTIPAISYELTGTLDCAKPVFSKEATPYTATVTPRVNSYTFTIGGSDEENYTIAVKQGETNHAKLLLTNEGDLINRITDRKIVKDITVTSDKYKGDVSTVARIDRSTGELFLTPPPAEPIGNIPLTVTVTTTTGEVYRGVVLVVTQGDLDKLLSPTLHNPDGNDNPTVTQVEPVVFPTTVTDPVTGDVRPIKENEILYIAAAAPHGIKAEADKTGNISVSADPSVTPGNYVIEVTYTFTDKTEKTVTKTVHAAPIAENTRYVYQWPTANVKLDKSVTITPVIHKENSGGTVGDVIHTSPAVKIEMVGAKDKNENNIEFPRWVTMGGDGIITAAPKPNTKTGDYVIEINITYADGTVEGQKASITVDGHLKDRYDPSVYGKVYLGETVKNVRVTPANGTEQIPTTVTYTIDDKYGVVTGDEETQTLTFTPKAGVPEGEHNATLTITYPDNSTDTVPLTYVIGSSFTSEKYDPVTYVTNAPRGKKSTIAAPFNRNKSITLPEGVTYEPGAGVPAWATFAKDGSVTLTPPRDAAPGHYIFTGIATYSDKSADDVVYEVVVPTKLPVDIYPVTRRNGVGVKLGKKLDRKMGTQKAGTVEIGEPTLEGLVDLGNVKPKDGNGNGKSGNNKTGKSGGKKAVRKVIRKVPKKTTTTRAQGKTGKTGKSAAGKNSASTPAANKQLATTGANYSPYIGLGVFGLSLALASVCALSTRREQKL